MASAIVFSCCKLLSDKKLTVAFAESASAGRLIAEFALSPESGKILTGALVCYDANIKEDILGIPASMIKKFTAESAEVTAVMAERLSRFIKSDISVAITGLTTPGGSETKEKPVGTMFIHILVKDKRIASRPLFKGSAEEIIMQTVERTAMLISDHVSTEFKN